MINLLRIAGWLGFTLVMTFLFLVLLDYGPDRFEHGFQQETQRIQRAIRNRTN